MAGGVSVVLGVAVVLGGNGAFAAQPLGQSVRVAQSTSPDRTNPGDVVVDTEPSTPGSTTPSSTSGSGSSNSTLAGTRFFCQNTNGQYTVMYSPESQPGQLYPWANPSTMGGGWSPDRRCNEIARRLESYRPDGLVEMRTGTENGYNTICVTTEAVPSCRIVLTVPQGEDPLAIRDRVFQNLTIADSGQQTQAVNTLVGNRSDNLLNQVGDLLNIRLPGLGRSRVQASNGINLRPFLDKNDGGTGQYLRRTAPNRPGKRLNPGNFR